MNRRSRTVLEILEKNRGLNVSGEYIANQLNASRNTVWRAVKSLIGDGYAIDASTKKGYRLAAENDMISAEGIKPFLRSDISAEKIIVYTETDSTNKEAKSLAIGGAPHGTVIISDGQTSGRGRQGRVFFSPKGSGLYISFILHPCNLAFERPTAVTAYAALCVCEAVEGVCGLNPSIKWVNDVFLGGKKVCGILTEAITEVESGGIGEIILGIGINVTTKQDAFPKELRGTAGSLYPKGVSEITRNRLAAEVINRIMVSPEIDEAEMLERYKRRLFMLGKTVSVSREGGGYTAKALDIDKFGRLVIQKESGEIEVLSSGGISVL